MSQYKKLIPFAILFIIIIIIITFIFSSKSWGPVKNEEGTSGNSAGNLLNGGQFCELDGKIYFSNGNDEGALYVMDIEKNTFKKLSEDKVSYINAIGDYLYYVRSNYKKQSSSVITNFKSTGICRIDRKGKKLNMLYDNASGLLNVYGNKAYFQGPDEEGNPALYSVSINGKGDKIIVPEDLLSFSIFDNTLYYADTEGNHNIHTFDLDSGYSTVLYDGNCYAPIRNQNYIYFMSLSNDYAIYRINADGSDPIPVVQERCFTYNITEDGSYLYYQVDNNESNRLCMLNLLTGESNTIMVGNYKELHIAGNYLFFNDFDNNMTYYIPVGSSTNAALLDPPNQSKK